MLNPNKSHPVKKAKYRNSKKTQVQAYMLITPLTEKILITSKIKIPTGSIF